MSNSQHLCNYLKKYKQLFVKEIYVSKKNFDDKNLKKIKEHKLRLDKYQSSN